MRYDAINVVQSWGAGGLRTDSWVILLLWSWSRKTDVGQQRFERLGWVEELRAWLVNRTEWAGNGSAMILGPVWPVGRPWP